MNGKYGKILKYDKDAGFVLRPDIRTRFVSPEFGWDFIFDTDGDGHRGGRRTGAKAPGEYRILMVGDSFTFGLGVNSGKTFSALLEKSLREQTGVNVRVMNAGVPSYGTIHETGYIKGRAKQFKPDLVIVAFYNNDFDDNKRNLAFVNGFIQKDPVLIFGNTLFLVELVDKALFANRRRIIAKPVSNAAMVNKANGLLREAGDFCERNGMKYMVFEVPDREHTKFRRPGRDGKMPSGEPISLGRGVFEMYGEFNRLDKDPYFLEHHLNEFGHERVALILGREILRRNLINNVSSK